MAFGIPCEHCMLPIDFEKPIVHLDGKLYHHKCFLEREGIKVIYKATVLPTVSEKDKVGGS